MRRPIPLLVCFLIPFLILATGLGIAATLGYRAAPQLLAETGRGEVPQGFEVDLPNPESYTLWAYFAEDSDPALASPFPSGARLHVFDQSSGRELERSSWIATVREIGGERSISMGSFSATRPGQKVLIKGTGIANAVSVSVVPTNSGGMLQLIFSLIGIVVVALSAAIVVFFALLHQRKKALEGASRRI